jgi:outer membrane receptor protein involved in Fe transport
MKSGFKVFLAAGISGFALTLAASASAQTADTSADDAEAIKTASEIVVQAQIGFRNRSEDAEPKLVYDNDYFQRFEPLTAGDALKRVPSVTFLSDVIESDGARLRGLDPGYTQILINGDKVPGANADRSFFLDRIPAELIKQVEIVRSSSARRTGDAVAGTLNIVLRDGYQLDGGYVRAGALRFDDGEVKPSLGAVFGGQLGPGRILLGANVQGRYNPKKKFSLRYGDSPENDPNYATNEFDNREDQSDVRDGTDYAFNATYDIDGETTDFKLSAFYVKTDRTETERSYEYDDPTAVSGSVEAGGNLLSDNKNVNEIDQDNYSIAGKLSHQWSAGETELKVSYARFNDRQDETEFQIDFDNSDPEFEGALTTTRVVDQEFSLGLDHSVPLGGGAKFVFGGFLQNKKRDSEITEFEEGDDLSDALHATYDQFKDDPTDFAAGYTDSGFARGGYNLIKEDRRDLFALVEGDTGPVKWEVGLRYETTDVRIEDRDAGDVFDQDYDYLLPSASAKINVGGGGRLTLSGARTVRRPRFDYLSPVTLEEELGDNDLRGNPLLRPEKAWGFDVGYEQRLGRTGVVGVNFFYRDVTDLVEIANTGEVREDDGDEFLILQPRNIGNGKVYGVEFDLSTDLGFIGLENTGVFGNFSLLDSEITDFLGERRFNGQSDYVYNFGLIQNFPSVGAAFGATYRKQGGAFDRLVAEEVTTTYGADLEVFVEKRFGKNFTIRAVGSNLLDGAKSETFNKFDTIDDQADRDFDEYELERETAGPVFQIMARLAF